MEVHQGAIWSTALERTGGFSDLTQKVFTDISGVRSEAEERERRRGEVREENSSGARREVIREPTGLAPGALLLNVTGHYLKFVFRTSWTGDGRR